MQAASSLPICVFAIPAGALADIFDKRKYLIVVESLYTILAAAYAAMVWVGLASSGRKRAPMCRDHLEGPFLQSRVLGRR
jgi:Transmembrane secretion effector